MKFLLPAALLGAMTVASVVTLANTQGAAPADSRNVVLDQSTPHDRLFSLVFDGDKGLAVGEAGLVKTTADGGNTWKRQKAPTDLAIIDVATNGTRSIAVGQVGLILVRDGDGPRKKVESGTDRRLLGVDVNKSGLAFATGAFGTLLKSTDGGNNWTSVAPNWSMLYDSGSGDTMVLRDEPTNYVVDVLDDGSVVLGGEYGQLMRSPDGGICWEIAYRHPSVEGLNAPTFFGMEIRPDGVGYAVGQSGLVARTQNNGQTWTHVPTPSEGNLFAVTSTADGNVVVVGQRAGLRSTDGGASWNALKALDLALNWYASVSHAASASGGEVIAVGHGGRIIKLAP